MRLPIHREKSGLEPAEHAACSDHLVTHEETDSSTTPSTWRLVCQIRQSGSDGRAYLDRKVAEGKTKKEAVRSLKRQVSNAVYRQLVLDAR